jgi:hypothetical protein
MCRSGLRSRLRSRFGHLARHAVQAWFKNRHGALHRCVDELNHGLGIDTQHKAEQCEWCERDNLTRVEIDGKRAMSVCIVTMRIVPMTVVAV